MNPLDNPNCYTVLYCRSHGGFDISSDGCKLVAAQFPDRASLFEDIESGCDARWIREDQEVIRFMIQTGLERFQGRYCELAIASIPIYEGIWLPYSISKYDGAECIRMDIDFRSVARDLASNERTNPLTQWIVSRGFDVVMTAVKQ